MGDGSNTDQYLTFRLADETYAMSVASIREVLEVPRITRVPRMPAYLEGIINLRGNVVPVMDLAQKFGIGKTAFTQDTSVIVTEITGVFSDDADETLVVGIFSDMVLKVVDIPRDMIEPPPSIGTGVDTSFIAGMGKVDDSFVIILKLDSVLSEEELADVDRRRGTMQ